MHGVKREKDLLVLQAKREADAVKIAALKEAQARCAALRATRPFERSVALELLAASEEVVRMSTAYYTMWSVRRECLLVVEEEEETREEEEARVSSELKLVEDILRVNPKSYCIWEHRLWVVRRVRHEELRASVEAREVKLCHMMLRADHRNFHCWNYKRVVDAAGPEELLAFTKGKISENPSNYSAWHQRSVTLARHPERFDEQVELQLVLNAIYTEPNDQSGWMYAYWLMEKGGPSVTQGIVAACQELLPFEPACKWLVLTLLRAGATEDRAGALERLAQLDPLRAGYYKSVR